MWLDRRPWGGRQRACESGQNEEDGLCVSGEAAGRVVRAHRKGNLKEAQRRRERGANEAKRKQMRLAQGSLEAQAGPK